MTETEFHPTAVIFDMDGLMLDTERPMIPTWTKAGELFGWVISQETVIRTIGMNGEGTRAVFMRELGPDFPYEKIRDEHHRLYSETFEKRVDMKPGLITLLDHLDSLGIPMAVATSSRRRGASWKLGMVGILDRFTALACGDEVEKGKPAPDVFLLAAERLGKKPAECIGFEDSPAGLQALHAAGIHSVFVKDLVEPPPDILAAVWRRYNVLSEAVVLF